MIGNIINLAVTLLECILCYQTLECIFITERKKEYYFIMKSVQIVALTFIITVTNNLSIYYIVALPFFVVLFISIGFTFLCRNNFIKVMAIVNLYYMTILLLDLIALFTLSVIFENPNIANIIGTSGNRWERIVFIIVMKTILIILFILFYKNRTNMRRYFEEYHKELFVISIILYISVVCYQKIAFVNINHSILRNWINFIITLILLITIFSLHGKYQKLLLEEHSIKLENQLLDKNYHNLDEALQSVSKRVHNMKSILNILEKYIEEYRMEEALAYIKEQHNELSQSKLKIWTDNKIINYVLNEKIHNAMEKGIVVQVDIAIPEVKIKEDVIYIILENIIDNAIEACERITNDSKWINILISVVNNMMVIKVVNSMEPGSICMKNGAIETCKENKRMHGFGLKIVQEKVDLYNGYMKYQICENVFEMNIGLFFE